MRSYNCEPPNLPLNFSRYGRRPIVCHDGIRSFFCQDFAYYLYFLHLTNYLYYGAGI